MNFSIVKAASDLGVHINGADKGATCICSIDKYAKEVYIVKKENIEKELDKNIKNKNMKYVNKFNEKLYNTVVSIDNFVITTGGDHSISIGSILASKKKNKNLGIIWIDAHSDYHNLDTTISGNIHGMPFATVTGQNGNTLSYFFDGEYINPKHSVLVGARDIEKDEYINLAKAGVTIFTTDDIKKYGAKKIMDKAFEIIKNNNVYAHVSYDLDVIDPNFAPGVSVKAEKGINIDEAFEILDVIIKNKDIVKSLDLVEYNPLNDINNKTLDIASRILTKYVDALK